MSAIVSSHTKLVFVETHTVVGVGPQKCHTVLFWGPGYDEPGEFRLNTLTPHPGGFGT